MSKPHYIGDGFAIDFTQIPALCIGMCTPTNCINAIIGATGLDGVDEEEAEKIFQAYCAWLKDRDCSVGSPMTM